jgi:hypothetical protein
VTELDEHGDSKKEDHQSHFWISVRE